MSEAVSPENATKLKTEIRNRGAIGKRFNLWVNDACSHEMYAIDVDLLTLRLSKRLLRIWEAKMPDEELSKGQKKALPLLAKGIELLIGAGLLNVKSGVFVVRGEPPFIGGAEVTQIASATEHHTTMTTGELIKLVDGRDA